MDVRGVPAPQPVSTLEKVNARPGQQTPEWIDAADPKASQALAGRKAVMAIEHNFQRACASRFDTEIGRAFRVIDVA